MCRAVASRFYTGMTLAACKKYREKLAAKLETGYTVPSRIEMERHEFSSIKIDCLCWRIYPLLRKGRGIDLKQRVSFGERCVRFSPE